MDEEMTDLQFNTIIKMVIQILKDSKSIEEAIEKIEGLVKNK